MATLPHMRGQFFRILALFCAFFLVSNVAHAAAPQKRVALIVANDNYRNVASLKNPSADARIVAEASKRAGFDLIMVGTNLTQRQFQEKLKQFQAVAAGADVAMVYFAGHGIEVDGRNWLIPVDAAIENPSQIAFEAIELTNALDAIATAKTRIVVLDACRNNPFATQWRSVSRSVFNGLSGVDIDDMLVLYSAAPGQVASDGSGANSPFAMSLAKRLQESGLPLQLLGGAVRDDVLKATNGIQRPFVSASMTGTPVYLMPPTAQTVATVPAAKLTSREVDELAWKSVLAVNTPEAARTYLKDFPKGRFVPYAQEMLRARNDPPTNRPATVVPVAAPVAELVKAPVVAVPSGSGLYAASYPGSGEGNAKPGKGTAGYVPAMSLDFAAVRSKAAVQPVPMTAPTGWITPDDYPAEALMRRAQGRAQFNLLVRPQGTVAGCEIVRSTGSPQLDKSTCDLIAERVRFIPAKSKSGKPIDGVYSSHLNWALPGGEAE